MRYGCVRFEDTRQHDRGWACIDNEKPFRIKGTEDLPSNITWMTNLSYQLMYQSGLSSHARFRRNDFLSIQFCPKIINENIKAKEDYFQLSLVNFLGINESDWSQQVKVGSVLFKNIMRCIFELIGLKDPPLYSLSQGIRGLIAPHDSIVSEDVLDALNDATINFVMVERDSIPENEKMRGFTFTLPKVHHAVTLLSTPVPVGEWQVLKRKEIPRTPKAINEWLDDFDFLFLAKITITQINSKMNRLLNFGSGRNTRRWVSTEELRLLANYCEFDIIKVFYNDKSIILPELNEIAERMIPNYEMSLSIGIALENIWKGICATNPPPPHRLKDNLSFNVFSTYIKAIDRAYCLMRSVQLQEEGYLIHGYGYGKVIALTEKNNLEIAESCLRMGLIPPFLDLEKTDIDFDSSDILEVFITMIAKGESQTALEADAFLLEQLEDKNE